MLYDIDPGTKKSGLSPPTRLQSCFSSPVVFLGRKLRLEDPLYSQLLSLKLTL